MVDVKEIKHIKAAPFTLMNASIQAIFAFIAAILFVIAFGLVAVFIPQLSALGGFLALIGVAVIILAPLTSFFLHIMGSFVLALLYNLVAPRVGGVKLGLEGSDVKTIPVVPLSLIMASISTIIAFIIGLYMALAFTPIFSLISTATPTIATAIANATNATNMTIPTGAAIGAAGWVFALVTIIVIPIVTFISSFISFALFAIFYNALTPRIGALKLDFAALSGNVFELTNIPAVPAALIMAVVFAIFGLIRGIFSLIAFSMAGDAVGGLVSLITTTIGYLVMYFVIVLLVALFYNLLQPRIGGVKLELE
ncbi:MAG: hypothetical protein ABFC91_07790 [Methanobacteriaceae archaeon]